MYRLSPKILMASLCSLLFWGGALACAQPSTPIVHWELQIIQEGQQVASLVGQTPLGQSYTETKHYLGQPKIGCNQPALELSRTITVTPDNLTPKAVMFTLETRETLEKITSAVVSNCTAPAAPRVVSASHPALIVPFDSWTNWQILPHNPTLIYRLRAHLNPA
ncbi:hypothetical protein [Mycoavidus sp. B2-EB]|uniref:hypothetical protein n=1 Tax=Mycoavidus sp. B2-EB TaxID=2651972 RepID=UPI00162832AA|nr:hypothetical protein [Mycoavidus sp. B2-EB]BBO60419.1 hypothetical protein MPB2EB_1560 [Mycoavidus sp. B2-EB]